MVYVAEATLTKSLAAIQQILANTEILSCNLANTSKRLTFKPTSITLFHPALTA
jgi:hypothetical protein